MPWTLGFKQSPIVSKTDMHNRCCCREWQMDNCLVRPFGTTLHRLLAPCYQLSTSSMADFHVKTSAVQELVSAWKASEAVCFSRSSDSLANYDHSLCSWKMSQLSLLEDWNKWSGPFPAFGMIVDGRLFQPMNLAPHTSEDDGFCLLPTPTAQTAGTNGKSWDEDSQTWINGRPSLTTMAKQNLWPTPRAQAGTMSHKRIAEGRTPDTLLAAVKMWPTPMASDWKNRGKRSEHQQIQLQTAVGGQLNPMWVEWLMAFPIEWTALGAWVMPWFRCKPERHLKD